MSSLAQPDFRGSARFEIEGQLGSGGFGVVYRAFDKKRNLHVALKTLRQADPSKLYRFKQEFRALADVNHRNLVMLYELLAEQGKWFFTMELIEGQNFLEYVRGRSNALSPALDTQCRRGWEGDIRETISLGLNPSSLDRLLPALTQLADGLCAIHEAGKLHCDIKPSNVLVNDDGRVVVLDFGLVAELGGDAVHTPELAGTPAYMSPEQAVGGDAISEASDWYSVGVMLYQALTGMLPFSGGLREILEGKRQSDLVLPVEWNPSLPADLKKLCADLLRFDPGQRPSATEVLRRLASLRPEFPRALPPSALPRIPLKVPSFVGRQAHRRAMQEAFEATREGCAVTVCVRGNSGIGKSALVRQFLTDLRRSEPELVVLEGRCHEREAVPFKALDGIVDSLSQYLAGLQPQQTESLLPRDIAALARLFPVIRRVEAVLQARRRTADISDAQELRRRAFTALRELLGRLAAQKPLVLFVDDLQWGDLDSAGLVMEIVRPPDSPPLLLALAYRTEEAKSSPLLQALLPGLADEAREIVVEELMADEARELALVLLAEQGSLERAEAIARESSGHPFFIETLLRSPQIRVRHNTVDEVIRIQVAELPERARRLLEVVALAGGPVPEPVARRAARLDAKDPAQFRLLSAKHLLRSRAGPSDELETYHDRIREAVVTQLSPERLKALHLDLAQAYESSGEPADPEVLAHHYKGAGEGERVAAYALAGADQAAAALAFDRAARLYRLALDSGGQDDDRVRVLSVKLGDALSNAGRGSEAAHAYISGAKMAAGAERLELQRRAAEQLLISGHLDEARETFRGVLEMVGMKMARTPRTALLSLLWRRMLIRTRGLRFRERYAGEIPATELLRIDACWSVGTGLWLIDPIRGMDFQARNLLLALKAGEPYRIVRALAMEAGQLSWDSGQHGTRRLFQAASELADRVPQAHAQAQALSFLAACRGAAAFGEGRWKESRTYFDRSEALRPQNEIQTAWEAASARLGSLATWYFTGELNDLSTRVASILKAARDRGDLFTETSVTCRFSHIVWLASGDPERARFDAQRAIERWSQQAYHVQHYWHLLAQAEIDLYCGEASAARRRVLTGWPALAASQMQRLQIFRIESLHLRARCSLAVAAAGHDREAMLRSAERDSRRIECEKRPWSDALALLLRGSAAGLRNESVRALALLVSAEQALQAVDMALYATAARRRRGELVGGAEGRAVVESADSWMAGQRIRNPGRMTAMIAPSQISPAPMEQRRSSGGKGGSVQAEGA